MLESPIEESILLPIESSLSEIDLMGAVEVFGRGWRMGEYYNAYPVIDDRVRIGPPFLTRYERARIIGVRAQQIGIGVPPLVSYEKVGSKKPLDIARFEVDNGILPVSVYRYHSSGEGQAIPLRVLIELGMKLGIRY